MVVGYHHFRKPPNIGVPSWCLTHVGSQLPRYCSGRRSKRRRTTLSVTCCDLRISVVSSSIRDSTKNNKGDDKFQDWKPWKPTVGFLAKKTKHSCFISSEGRCVCVCFFLYCKKPKDEKQEFAFPFNFMNVLL